MLAWMNDEALKLTLDTGQAHYFSRSRNRLWKKGETSGQVQTVSEIRIDCDQDAVWLKVITRWRRGRLPRRLPLVLLPPYRRWHIGRDRKLRGVPTMSSEGLHAPRERLSAKTISLHQAITSLIEELEAVDWYRQRADDCDDPELKRDPAAQCPRGDRACLHGARVASPQRSGVR